MPNHIKIYGVKPRIQYVADGILSAFEFPFAIFKTSDVDVYFDDKLQDQATYTVSGNNDTQGGSVIFKTAPAKGIIVSIIRNLSIERTTDFQEGGALRAKVLNDELDYQIACQQQIADSLNRSMVLPPYAVDTDVDLTLPTPSAGKAIVWNKDGTNLENSVVEVNALESTLRTYKESAESSATLAGQQASIASDKADIATEQAQVATEKVNKILSNKTVIETYIGNNNWYRIWSDGWIEQGGYVNNNSSTEPIITFLKPFSNTGFFACCVPHHSNQLITACTNSWTTTELGFKMSQASWFKWYACGY